MKLFLVILTLTIMSANGTMADTIWSDDLEISVGSVVSDTFRITMPLVLTNHGTISGTIYTDAPFALNFVVQNDGLISANFYLSSHDTLSQYISTIFDVTRLNVTGGSYIPIIRDNFTGTLSASDLLTVFDAPVRIDKNGLNLSATMSELPALANLLDIRGSVVLNLLDYDGRDLSLLGFNGTIFFSVGNDNDPMFNYVISDGQLRRMRELDYMVILGENDKRSGFLNDLRVRDPGNRILGRLDQAMSRSELSEIMSNSMFFNPLVLNYGIKTMISRPNLHNHSNLDKYFYNIRPILDGNNSGLEFTVGRRNMFAGFYIGDTNENDDQKYGSASVYGFTSEIRYGWLTGGGKYFAANWHGVTVMDSDGVAKSSIQSRLFYLFLDVSPPDWLFSPIGRLQFVGEGADRHKDADLSFSYGARLSFSRNTRMGTGNRFGAYVMKNPNNVDIGASVVWDFLTDQTSLAVNAGPRNLSLEIRGMF